MSRGIDGRWGYPFSPWRLCRTSHDHTDVMLSTAKHLAFSNSREDEILHRSLS